MDPTTILTMVSTASGLIKTVADLTTDAKVREKTVEANNALIAIQSGLITMQKESLELQQDNEKLKRQIEQFNNWEETKKYYTLVHLGKCYIYQANESHPINELKPYICPNCFNDKLESILQYLNAGQYICPKCKNAFYSH